MEVSRISNGRYFCMIESQCIFISLVFLISLLLLVLRTHNFAASFVVVVELL